MIRRLEFERSAAHDSPLRTLVPSTDMHIDRKQIVIWTATVATALLVASFAPGQDARPRSSVGSAPQGAAAGVPDDDTLPDNMLGPADSPLLREGTQLVDVRGWMEHDEDLGAWTFVIDEKDEAAPGYALTLLPSAVLQEMMELRRIADESRLAFEVSGRVLVYHGRSYFLPTYAPRIVGRAPADVEEPAPVDESGDAPVPPADDDSVQSIMRDLEAAVGPVARTGTTTSAARADRSARRLEGSMVVARRGRLTRTSAGAWRFVFDADASGLADPPMTVLPCLLLERMERYARSRGGVAPMIISGRVLAFNGRNYLYPSVFQIPRGRTKLTP